MYTHVHACTCTYISISLLCNTYDVKDAECVESGYFSNVAHALFADVKGPLP